MGIADIICLLIVLPVGLLLWANLNPRRRGYYDRREKRREHKQKHKRRI